MSGLSIDPIGYEADINLYRYVHNNPVIFTDPMGLTVTVEINGWDMFGKSDQDALEKAAYDALTTVQKAQLAIDSDVVGTAKFGILSAKDPELKAKYEWMSKLIVEYFRRLGSSDAADNLAYWLTGKGNSGTPPKLKLEVLKQTKVYRALLEKLTAKCKASETGSDNEVVKWDPANYDNGNVAFLMGEFTYKWTLGARQSDGSCVATFEVDDPYDFHSGKDASITTGVRKVTRFKQTWNVTGIVDIPDAVLLQMKEVLGAKEFDRKVTWEEKICDPAKRRKPPANW